MSTLIFHAVDGGQLHVSNRSDELRLVIKEEEQTIIARFSYEDLKELLEAGGVENSICYDIQHSYSVNKTVLVKEESKVLFFYDNTCKEIKLWNEEFDRLISHLSTGEAA